MFDKPQARTGYEHHISQNKNVCVFCSKEEELIIAKYEHFVWKYAAFPYQKFHTLLIPVRHVETIAELEAEEFTELQKITSVIEKAYRESMIVSDNSEFGSQLLYTWRTRGNRENEGKKAVLHFHIHIYPRHQAGDDIQLNVDAHVFDINILKEFT